MEERGVPTDQLKEMGSGDIMVLTKILRSLNLTIQKMINCFEDADKFIKNLDTVRDNYDRTRKLLCKQMLLVSKGEFYDEYKTKQIHQESDLFTKAKVIQDFKIEEKSYDDLCTLLEDIDREYYMNQLKLFMSDVYMKK